jgi:hypothetical protein
MSLLARLWFAAYNDPMPIFDRFFGLLAALSYGLHRARVGFLRLRVALIMLCCLYAALTAYRGWRAGFAVTHCAAIALCLGLAAALLWVHQRQYIVFREGPATTNAMVPELRPEEKLLLRCSGVFQVSRMTRYLVEVPVVFWTTQLADHILAAKVRALNVLGIGVPSEERGWWYIFIEPKRIVDITTGDLCFGLRSRPAVRVQFNGEQGRQTVHFSCDGVSQRDRLLQELQARARGCHQGTG